MQNQLPDHTMKTSELTGYLLDWAVAKCEGTLHDDGSVPDYFQPSLDWEQGGAIIESEIIELEHDGFKWWARIKADEDFNGTTPLEAAMRCYVAQRLGNEVEVPDELINCA